MRKGPLFGSPPYALLLFFFFGVFSWFLLFLLIAPVLTSITPIRASNAHG